MDKEIEKFSKLSGDWWKEKSGAFKMLHKINHLRAEYILNNIRKYKSESKNISILDVGCGGGILTEKIAENGYEITGIDPSLESIEEARAHSKFAKASYENLNVEEMTEEFDVIFVMEVLEHVQNIEIFLKACIRRLKKGGMLFFSTINRTTKSFLLAIVVAEYVMNMLPKNTHEWNKFLKPSEIYKILYCNKILIKDLQGIKYDILSNKWLLCDDINVNYMGFAINSHD